MLEPASSSGANRSTTTYTTRDFRFLLSLKNVGTFLDLHGGTKAGY